MREILCSRPGEGAVAGVSLFVRELAGMHVVIQLEKLKKSEKLYFIQPLYINNHALFILMLLSLRNTFNKEKIQQLK